MPIRHAIWTVGSQPTELKDAMLPSEQVLEAMIVSAPRILSDEWMLIGRQEDTGYGGRIDLLAIAPDGSLVLIELKRSRTPREVVAQTLDYASWVDALEADDIARIYGRFKPNGNLADDFKARFDRVLDEDTLNESHEMVIVASELDPGTERIVRYLEERGIAINVLFFQVFQNGRDQMLSRAWLIDPVETQANVAAKPKGEGEPWNGEFYANFGQGVARSWAEGMKYGFISAGGGTWYSKSLGLLRTGDRVWVNAPGNGYVGVGIVKAPAQPIASFVVDTPEGEKPAAEVLREGTYHREFIDDPEQCEYFVPMRWLDTTPIESAFKEIGLFGVQNTISKPTTPKWRHTIDRLKTRFPNFASK
jgi:hypothetical protein